MKCGVEPSSTILEAVKDKDIITGLKVVDATVSGFFCELRVWNTLGRQSLGPFEGGFPNRRCTFESLASKLRLCFSAPAHLFSCTSMTHRQSSTNLGSTPHSPFKGLSTFFAKDALFTPTPGIPRLMERVMKMVADLLPEPPVECPFVFTIAVPDDHWAASKNFGAWCRMSVRNFTAISSQTYTAGPTSRFHEISKKAEMQASILSSRHPRSGAEVQDSILSVRPRMTGGSLGSDMACFKTWPCRSSFESLAQQ